MSATDVVFMHRDSVRKVAMHMARAGLSPETIRAAMADLASTEAEHAIKEQAAEDARWASYEREASICGEDRRDVGDEWAREEIRLRAVGE